MADSGMDGGMSAGSIYAATPFSSFREAAISLQTRFIRLKAAMSAPVICSMPSVATSPSSITQP